MNRVFLFNATFTMVTAHLISHFLFYLLMKHAPSLESNTTCCELVGNAGPAPYPGAVAAFPLHSFLEVIQCIVFSAAAITVGRNLLSL